jgi:antitoxin HicB
MKVNDYMKLPYAVSVEWDADDEFFVARIGEIPECSGHGTSRNQAIDMAFDNLRDWIEDALESRERIPKPAPKPDLPSGKWVQRVPRSMHAELVILASKDGVSLNQLVVSILSRELGYRSGQDAHQVKEIGASADPSTSHWTLIQDEIAVNQSWLIKDQAKPKAIDAVYLKRLVNEIPQIVVVDDKKTGKYGEKTDHKDWN